jgi:HK97 family phage major capsid protein
MSGDHSMVRAAMSTFDNDLGGYLVPTPLSNLISELRQARGVARQECQIVPMTSASLALPKLASEVTASFIGESEELVESDPTLAQVMLQAKKLGVLVAMSSEVADDAVLTIVEMLARSTAYAFASKEDDCLFNGDSTSTYGHINGLKSALAAGSKVTATGQSSFGALTLAQFESVVGRCKRWATAEDPKWYFSRPGYFASASRLVNAAGGNSNNDLANGANEQTFLGYPVRFSDAIHSNLGASSGQVACYFGDLRSGVYMGDRKRIAIAADGSTRFSRDQILFRGLERFDINVHDTGTSTEAGGIVSLVFG